jgi:glycosyltransferase involved in cell wall biosynthesis
MRIAYVLATPELGGGTKVVFQHADLLAATGAEVTVLGQGPRPSWVTSRADYLDYAAGPPAIPSQDLVVATYWTTLEIARRWDAGPCVHFCQGYEGGLEHLQPRWAEIDAAYSQPLPTWTVTPYLQEFLRQKFDRRSRVVSPPVDPLFRPAWRWRPRRRPWIAVPGIFEAPVKGVATALAALELLKNDGLFTRLLRFSPLPLSAAEEQLRVPDRYLHGVAPAVVAQHLRRCDLLLFPSRCEEGFGLPLLEAQSAGVPAVASRIPATEFITGGALPLAPFGDAAAFAEEAGKLLRTPSSWRRVRRAGRRESRRFAPERITAELLEAVRWAREQPTA